MTKYLIDIGHPAHVHYFKNFVNEVQSKGDKVLFTCRDKEFTISLLDHNRFKYVNFGRNFKSKTGKVFGLFYFTIKLFIVSLKFKPDMYLNATMYSAIVAWLLKKPHISLEDTFNMEQVRLYKPFTDVILSGDYPHPSQGKKEIQYTGYQELMYLHPKYFTPDTSVLQLLKIKPFEKYVVFRFVAWNASHDNGQGGFSNNEKIDMVNKLSKQIKIFISAEGSLPDELSEYRLKVPPHLMHDVLAFSSLFVGEGATMASECAMLGVPAIYVNSLDVYTIREQAEKYSLIYSYRSAEGVIEKAKELLMKDNIQEFKKKAARMLNEKINVTSFLIWFIENWPDSLQIMKQNPDFQKRFR